MKNSSYGAAEKAKDKMIVTDEIENNDWHEYIDSDF